LIHWLSSGLYLWKRIKMTMKEINELSASIDRRIAAVKIEVERIEREALK